MSAIERVLAVAMGAVSIGDHVTAEIRVSVPARPQFVQVLRAVAASVAARLDFPYDVIEDLRLAVDEAFGQLLRLPGPATELLLRLAARPGRLEAVACSDAKPEAWPPPGADRSLGWQVLSGLTDHAGFEQYENGPALRFGIGGGEA
jgi:serine/threonine-protein kinase RsbW